MFALVKVLSCKEAWQSVVSNLHRNTPELLIVMAFGVGVVIITKANTLVVFMQFRHFFVTAVINENI